jgi:hypothetical protein
MNEEGQIGGINNGNIEKHPDDTIVFRQLKPKANLYEPDFEDE